MFFCAECFVAYVIFGRLEDKGREQLVLDVIKKVAEPLVIKALGFANLEAIHKSVSGGEQAMRYTKEVIEAEAAKGFRSFYWWFGKNDPYMTDEENSAAWDKICEMQDLAAKARSLEYLQEYKESVSQEEAAKFLKMLETEAAKGSDSFTRWYIRNWKNMTEEERIVASDRVTEVNGDRFTSPSKLTTMSHEMALEDLEYIIKTSKDPEEVKKAKEAYNEESHILLM